MNQKGKAHHLSERELAIKLYRAKLEAIQDMKSCMERLEKYYFHLIKDAENEK